MKIASDIRARTSLDQIGMVSLLRQLIQQVCGFQKFPPNILGSGLLLLMWKCAGVSWGRGAPIYQHTCSKARETS